MALELSIRATHRYVGTWRDLDEWQTIGSAEQIGSEQLPVDPEDYCEPTCNRVYLKVALDQPEPKARIEQAIHDQFQAHGCACEHDCCGCRSYWCDEVTHEGGAVWSARVSSSRNY